MASDVDQGVGDLITRRYEWLSEHAERLHQTFTRYAK